jgi:hypothetical protein
MVRSILVGASGAVLSWVLVILSVVAWLSWTPSGRFIRGARATFKDSTAVHAQCHDPFGLLESAKLGFQIWVFPAISIITGLFVGRMGTARAGWLATAALAPLQIFLLAAESLAVSAFLRTFVYLLLGYFSASLMHRLAQTSASRKLRGSREDKQA